MTFLIIWVLVSLTCLFGYVVMNWLNHKDLELSIIIVMIITSIIPILNVIILLGLVLEANFVILKGRKRQ